MIVLGTLYIMIILAATDVTVPTEVMSAVVAHYDSLLTGRTVSWEVALRRCPPVCAESLRISGVRGDEETGVPRGTRLCWVDVIADGHHRSLPVTVVVKPVELVPIAARDIPARTEMNDSLVEWRAQSTEKLGAAQLPNPEQLDGLWAKSPIPAGRVLTIRRLAKVPAVKIGQGLDIVSRKGLVEVHTAGRALEDSRIGEKIRVLNIDTGRRLKGRVESGGVVVVE